MAKKMLITFVLAMLSSAAFPAMMGTENVPPVVTIRRLSARELFGKTVTQAIWSRPVSIPCLGIAKHGNIPTASTEIRLAYDYRNLYVAYRCFEDAMDKLVVTKNEHDADSRRDDSVMMIIDLDNDPSTYLYLAANTAGMKFDSRDSWNPGSWTGNWSVDINKKANEWTALVTIPFKELNTPLPELGTVWNINLCRGWPKRREESMWANSHTDFRVPRFTGQFVFAGSDAITAAVAAPIITVPGQHSLLVTASNPTDQSVDLESVVVSGGKEIARFSSTAKPGVNDLKLDFKYLQDGWNDLNATVTNAASKAIIARSPKVPVRCGDHRSRLTRFATKLDSMTLPASSANESSALRNEVDDLLKMAQQAEGSYLKWKALRPSVEKIELKMRAMQALSADSKSVGYAVGTETAVRRVMRDKLFEGKFGEPLKMSACKDEFESGQVVIMAHTLPVKGVSVSATPLTGPDGAVISDKDIKLDLVDYVETREPPYEIDYIGWYPDPIIDLTTFDVAVGGIRPVWVTVHVPKDSPAGIYRGEITVKPSDGKETIVPIEVNVWDFSMPKRLHLRTAFALSEAELETWYGKPVTDEQRREWYAFLLDKRINPTNIYSKTPVPTTQDMEFCVDRGLNAYTVAVTWGKEGKPLEDLIARIRENEQFTKPRGWWDMAFLYGFDELDREKYAELCSTYGAVKNAFPELKRMTTVHPNEELKGCVDIWVPLTPRFDPEVNKKYIADGDEVWWYTCCWPSHPYTNFFIDYPAIDSRIMFWMNWKYQVPGFLYYMTNLWRPNRVYEEERGVKLHDDPAILKAIKAGKRWPEIPWNTSSCASFNGDGQLLYPGVGGKPWSSIRLECIRDGIEDYEYFYILDSLVKESGKNLNGNMELVSEAKKLLSVRDDVVKSTTQYTLEPDALLGARQQVAEMIEKLSVSK